MRVAARNADVALLQHGRQYRGRRRRSIWQRRPRCAERSATAV